jgi:hypothetical protein
MKRILSTMIIVVALLALLAPTAGAGTMPRAGLPQGDAPQATAPTIVSYQGRVTVSGSPYTGTGYFKFAIIDQGGTTSYWSNDGTSVNGSEPIGNVPLGVSAGLFNVLLGDTTLPGMTQPLTASAFSADGRSLRVWFATGAGGPYTLLTPDRPLAAAPYALSAETLDGQDASAFANVVHNHWGQSWSGSGTGLTLSGGGTGMSGAGIDYGIYGTSEATAIYGSSSSAASTDHYGLYGIASGSNSTDYGVYGTSDDTGVKGEITTSTSGMHVGVRGIAITPDVFDYGVFGTSDNTGVYGQAGSTTTGVHYGVFGAASGSNSVDYGLYGSGDEYGVYGTSNGSAAVGVYGTSNNTGVYGFAITPGSGTIYGLRGNASGSNSLNYGVYGSSDDTGVYGSGASGIYGSGTGTGVYGTATTYGVYAVATNTAVYGTGGPYGIYASATGTALYGASGTYGVYTTVNSTNGRAMYGHATATSGETRGVWGLSASVSGTGVEGWAYATTGVNYGVYGHSISSAGYGVYSYGNFAVLGGTKSAIVDTPDYGVRHLYAMESPDNWFEDFGQAQLVDGKATVTIEPVFAQTVNLSQPYHVFAMPLGNCPLYIAEKTTMSFTVRALDGQTGASCDIAFDYRIIAKRLGYEDLRLGPAQDPATTRAPDRVPGENP